MEFRPGPDVVTKMLWHFSILLPSQQKQNKQEALLLITKFLLKCCNPCQGFKLWYTAGPLQPSKTCRAAARCNWKSCTKQGTGTNNTTPSASNVLKHRTERKHAFNVQVSKHCLNIFCVTTHTGFFCARLLILS